MSENKATKDKKDEVIGAEKEAEIQEDIKEVTQKVADIPVVKDVPVSNKAPGHFKFEKKGGRGRGGDREREPKEFEEKVVAVDRVTRVVKGGRRMRFRALVVVGDKKGRIGYGLGKGNEVVVAVNKGANKAKKGLLHLDIQSGTIPHDIIGKSRSTRVLLKKAKKGRGIIAGGAVRIVLELAGYSDIVSKSYGSNNKTNNVIATLDGLGSLLKKKKKVPRVAEKKDAKAPEKKEVSEKPKKEAKK